MFIIVFTHTPLFLSITNRRCLFLPIMAHSFSSLCNLSYHSISCSSRLRSRQFPAHRSGSEVFLDLPCYLWHQHARCVTSFNRNLPFCLLTISAYFLCQVLLVRSFTLIPYGILMLTRKKAFSRISKTSERCHSIDRFPVFRKTKYFIQNTYL